MLLSASLYLRHSFRITWLNATASAFIFTFLVQLRLKTNGCSQIIHHLLFYCEVLLQALHRMRDLAIIGRWRRPMVNFILAVRPARRTDCKNSREETNTLLGSG
jgi:hypothetical protein